jgi:DNA-binding transcriptional LysR family regulator
MKPTPRALRHDRELRVALQEVQAALTPETFDPVAAEGGFTIAVETYQTMAVLPHLVEIRKEAPGVELQCVQDRWMRFRPVSIAALSTWPSDRFEFFLIGCRTISSIGGDSMRGMERVLT